MLTVYILLRLINDIETSILIIRLFFSCVFYSDSDIYHMNYVVAWTIASSLNARDFVSDNLKCAGLFSRT